MNCFWTSAATCKNSFRKDGPLGKKRLDDEGYSELREHARERVPDRNGPLHHEGGRKVGQELDPVQLCHEVTCQVDARDTACVCTADCTRRGYLLLGQFLGWLPFGGPRAARAL